MIAHRTGRKAGNMRRIALIADDFSSITDCGVQFSTRGIRTAALMDIPAEFPDAELIAVDADSRALPPDEAYQRVFSIALKMKRAGCASVYKSLDSTLRGNIGAEIDAVMDAFGIRHALIAPAFPFYGRRTIGGIHYLEGTELGKSPISTDPVSPVRCSDVREIISGQSKRTSALVPLEMLRLGTGACADHLRRMFREGTELAVFDIETEADLRSVSELCGMFRECLAVGSTGLAQYMPHGWGLEKECASAGLQASDRPVLFAAASASGVTLEQIEFLKSRIPVTDIVLDLAMLSRGEAAGYADEAAAAMASGRDVVIRVDATSEGRRRIREAAGDLGLSETEVPRTIVSGMGSIVRTLMYRYRPGGILMTGGDTAKAICTCLGAYGMDLRAEAEPGIPAGPLMGTDRINVSIKAGAFGTREALVKVRYLLRGITV